VNRSAALAVTTVFLAACGSDHRGGGTPAKTSPSSAKLTLSTAKGPGGTYVTDGSGRALYEWVADRGGKSSCAGACAQAWPPVATKDAPTASAAVHASGVGTTVRADGVKQVTYDGHPLYYYAGDDGPGTTTGQGSNGFGAKWWLVTRSGGAITTSASAGSSGGGSGVYG
jgi:predicted lipoprotein with Yx(FWY)xxD motif